MYREFRSTFLYCYRQDPAKFARTILGGLLVMLGFTAILVILSVPSITGGSGTMARAETVKVGR